MFVLEEIVVRNKKKPKKKLLSLNKLISYRITINLWNSFNQIIWN